MNYYNYFTEIEEHFVKRRGKHLLVSPADWGLMAAWRDAGVPLHVALRGIDIAMDGFLARKHRGSSKVNSLCYCHDAVMAEYAGYLESHVGQPPAADSEACPGQEPQVSEIAGLVGARIEEINALCAKQSSEHAAEGLLRVLARLEEILRNQQTSGRVDSEALERDLALVDDLLVTELRRLVSPDEMLEWEKEAKRELKVYSRNLPKETYDRIRSNFLGDKIHRKFQIGELSLFRL